MKKTIVLFLFFSLSCNGDSNLEPVQEKEPVEIEDPQDESPKDPEPQPANAFHFPSSVDAGNCTYPSIAPEFCDWGLAAHDIIMLEVSSVELILSPSVADAATQNLVQDCEGAINPGLKINGRVTQSVNGITGEISVDVGSEQLAEWNSSPYRDVNGNMKWFSEDTRIKSGDLIGLTIYKNPNTGSFGILGEHFFDLDENGKIRFAEVSYECEEPDPKKVAGNTFEEIRGQLQKCTKTSASEARIQQKEDAWNFRSFADLGVCIVVR